MADCILISNGGGGAGGSGDYIENTIETLSLSATVHNVPEALQATLDPGVWYLNAGANYFASSGSTGEDGSVILMTTDTYSSSDISNVIVGNTANAGGKMMRLVSVSTVVRLEETTTIYTDFFARGATAARGLYFRAFKLSN